MGAVRPEMWPDDSRALPVIVLDRVREPLRVTSRNRTAAVSIKQDTARHAAAAALPVMQSE